LPEPGDARWFIQHLASKVQNPLYRGLGVIMTTPIQGTGRGTLENILARLWGEWNVSRGIQLDTLIKAIDGANNGFLSTEWLIVKEAEQATIDAKVEKKLYTSLKSYVEPGIISFPIQDKYIVRHFVDINSSIIICSQNASALHIEAGDRRFVQMANPIQVRDDAYFKSFSYGDDAWINSGFESHVWRYLAQLDLTDFDLMHTDRRAKNKDDQMHQQRTTASPIDYAVVVAIEYVNLYCQGILHIPQVESWVAGAAMHLNMPDNWQRHFHAKVSDLTRPTKTTDDVAIKFKIDKKTFQPRCTIHDIGNASMQLVVCEDARGGHFKDSFKTEHTKLFFEYVKTVNQK
jgi:hypothetical protein